MIRGLGPRVDFEDDALASAQGYTDLDAAAAAGRRGGRRAMVDESLRGQSAILSTRDFTGLEPEEFRSAGRAADLLRLEGDDDAGRALTVTCSGPDLVFPSPAGATTRAPVVGLLQWGLDAGRSEAEFDWIVGTALTLWASHIRVSARFEDAVTFPATSPPTLPPVTVAGAALAIARIRAFVAEQPYGEAVPPQRTMLLPPLSIVSGVLSAIVTVPRYSHSVRLVMAPAGGTVVVEGLDDGAAAALWSVSYPGTILPSNMGQILPLSNDTRRIRVTLTAGTVASARLVFGLRI